MSKRTFRASDAMKSVGRRAERLAPTRRSSRVALAVGLVAAVGVTAIAIRFFPDMRRYVRIKTM
jgi:hypothetical protein